MTRPVIITCAVTGGEHSIALRNPHVPVTPEEIANECIAAAKAGAAVAHIHVRDIETKAATMDLALYREVVTRLRASNTDIIINLTCGPGAFYIPSDDNPQVAGPGSDLASPEARVAHILELKPEICSVDVVTFNHGGRVFMNTAAHLEQMAELIKSVGTKPELEAFDLGNVLHAKDLIKRGVINGPGLFQFCLGIPWGAPATVESMSYLRSHLPDDAVWAGFGVAAMEFPMAAAAVLLGGHVRVGLEDNIFLERGKLAEGNAPLVARAVDIIESIGDRVATPDEAREILGLR
ncbi:3-keto-5-aminohexanoate cleavage protein [Pseudorhodobacter sp. W20_MBD10_FR17]|uniref:3-keto-5-aminohexanoate cleavage protein n=1 Tax=Pseudorhodobacter sp. W20_MBD10_FR17 TaxID=3240266 RepID=UPI003F9E9CEF